MDDQSAYQTAYGYAESYEDHVGLSGGSIGIAYFGNGEGYVLRQTYEGDNVAFFKTHTVSYGE